jgi:hypothetical protein
MPEPQRTEAEFRVFVATLETHADDLIIQMAVMNRVVEPAGPFGQRTREALQAEAERRGLSYVVGILAGAAIKQGKGVVEGDGEA